MAKKKDSEKQHEDGQKGNKYNKDDADADLENFVDDVSDEGK